MPDGTASEFDHGTFLDLAHLTAAIDVSAYGGTIGWCRVRQNVYLRPNGGGKLRRVVLVGSGFFCGIYT